MMMTIVLTVLIDDDDSMMIVLILMYSPNLVVGVIVGDYDCCGVLCW